MPSPLAALVLALATYRLVRLAGWDDFPLAAKVRAWVIGERWVPTFEEDLLRAFAEPVDLTMEERLDLASRMTKEEIQSEAGRKLFASLTEDVPSLPGKQPSSEVDAVRPAYDRPTLAHLVHCAWCVSFWISLATWGAWLAWHPVIYGLVPFALSAFAGLVARNLDA